MKRHLIYCGCASPLGDEDKVATIVRDLAGEYFPKGHTIHEALGRWHGLFSGIIDERTLIVEVWEVEGFDPPPVGKFAGAFKEAGRQESVVILEIPCTAVVL